MSTFLYHCTREMPVFDDPNFTAWMFSAAWLVMSLGSWFMVSNNLHTSPTCTCERLIICVWVCFRISWKSQVILESRCSGKLKGVIWRSFLESTTPVQLKSRPQSFFSSGFAFYWVTLLHTTCSSVTYTLRSHGHLGSVTGNEVKGRQCTSVQIVEGSESSS